MRKFVLAAAAVAAASGFVPGTAGAQQGPNLIETRQVAFALMSGDFAGIRAVAAAKGDVKTLENPAKAIGRYAAIIPSLFPQGTAAGFNTRASPDIWTKNDDFKKAAATLGDAAAVLVKAAAAGDAAGVDEAIKGVGAACGACHRAFQTK